MQAIEIKEKIFSSNPALADYLFQLPEIDKLQPKNISVLDAVSRIVIGQMLSKQVAKILISRTENLAIKQEKRGIAFLTEKELRACGISANKAKAINIFAENYLNDEEKYENHNRNWKRPVHSLFVSYRCRGLCAFPIAISLLCFPETRRNHGRVGESRCSQKL